MQNILIIVHAPPYGSERCLSALRLATALAGNDAKPKVSVFLMSDATVLGLPNQVDGAGNGLQFDACYVILQTATVRKSVHIWDGLDTGVLVVSRVGKTQYCGLNQAQRTEFRVVTRCNRYGHVQAQHIAAVRQEVVHERFAHSQRVSVFAGSQLVRWQIRNAGMEGRPQVDGTRFSRSRQQQRTKNIVVEGSAVERGVAFQAIQSILTVAEIETLQRVALNTQGCKSRNGTAKQRIVHVQREFRIVKISVEQRVRNFLVRRDGVPVVLAADSDHRLVGERHTQTRHLNPVARIRRVAGR